MSIHALANSSPAIAQNAARSRIVSGLRPKRRFILDSCRMEERAFGGFSSSREDRPGHACDLEAVSSRAWRAGSRVEDTRIIGCGVTHSSGRVIIEHACRLGLEGIVARAATISVNAWRS